MTTIFFFSSLKLYFGMQMKYLEIRKCVCKMFVINLQFDSSNFRSLLNKAYNIKMIELDKYVTFVNFELITTMINMFYMVFKY